MNHPSVEGEAPTVSENPFGKGGVGFEEAMEAALPILREMQHHLRGAPTASRASVERLLAAAKNESAKNNPESGALRTPSTSKNAPKNADSPMPLISGNSLPPGTSPVSQKPAIPDDGRLARLEELKHKILSCTRCPNLVASRTQVVYGVGNPFAELLFVGEAPGEEEDLRGEPFVGRAGQLLTRIIGAMEFAREEVFIANVLKCRPDMPTGVSGNRKPKPEEMATCLPWLKQQIDLIKPKVIVALGLTAVEGLLGEARTMREVRGKWLDYDGVPLMPTYHPAYLLRNQSLSEKRKVWEDMLLVLQKLGRPISAKQRGYFLEKA